VEGSVGMPAAKAEAVIKRMNAARLFFMVNGGKLVLSLKIFEFYCHCEKIYSFWELQVK
jgi:hypothetical protein